MRAREVAALALLALRGLRERVQTLRPRDEASRAASVDAFALYAGVLARGRELTASWGGESLLAYLPSYRRVAHGAEPDANARAVLEVARGAGIASLDLGDALRAQPDPVGLYAYPSDTAAGPAHLNEAGCAVVAEALRNFLTSR